jgi:hypothetical protein
MRFFAAIIFLNLFKADTQFLSELIPAHFHRSPSAANLIGKDVYRSSLGFWETYAAGLWLLSRSLS